MSKPPPSATRVSTPDVACVRDDESAGSVSLATPGGDDDHAQLGGLDALWAGLDESPHVARPGKRRCVEPPAYEAPRLLPLAPRPLADTLQHWLLERRALLEYTRAAIEQDRSSVRADLERWAHMRALADARIARLAQRTWSVPNVDDVLDEDILCL